MKKILTESQLKKVVTEATKRVLKEAFSQSVLRDRLAKDIAAVLEDDDLSGIAIVKDAENGLLTAKPIYDWEVKNQVYNNGTRFEGSYLMETIPVGEIEDPYKIADNYFDLRLGESRISLSDYDNPNVRYNRLDGDELGVYDGDYDPGVNDYEFGKSEDEEFLNRLLKMRNEGVISDEELNRMRDSLGI